MNDDSSRIRGGPPVPDDARAEPRLSDILHALSLDERLERVSVADILPTLRDRTFGALMLVFAAPNVLPVPAPGLSSLLALPLLYLSAQLMLGQLQPSLPEWLARRSIARRDFHALTMRLHPWLRRAERLLRPRLRVLTAPPFERAIGAVCLVLALILLLPIPFGNMLPGLAISLFALALLERDGISVLAGALTTAAGLAVVYGVLYALAKAMWFVLVEAVHLA